MEEKPFKALGPSGSGKSSLEDIRNLWTTASLSQSQLNLPLSDVCEDSHVERSSLGHKTRQWYNQKTGHYSDVAWEKSVARDKVHFKQEKQDDRSLLELERRRGSSQGSHLEGDDDSKTDTELRIWKHTTHQAYWEEQHNRLPLPLMELMENEALEILTEALRSYRSSIGGDHFLTKELQQYIERLKRRRSKRLHVSVH
ncbi:cation channel sperm-associated auxiliary subunit zeta isoform X2 [Manis pentadactyla]|uniref:cation channel sperm-associated auxiliary subunit zeta isoform X2 n=1 Tax=Manis pentadactyla TaxID=143292 RepID=UPI00255D0911|nr:cation channel sperm-associated auxiliary subunit zeta isoform X2 [Manis pentadactyla]KAI5277992.1 Cation Channel Sperm-Associated Protein Subunit Zeta [Manis pentadactyla]